MNKRIAILSIVLILFVSSLGCLALETTAPGLQSDDQVVKATPTISQPVVVAPSDSALASLQSQVEAVYEAVGDTVVNITVTSIGYDFFMNPMSQEGSGSGFVYDAEGHIVTNFHVVEGAEDIRVTFADGKSLAATVVGSDPANDLAVIRVDPGEHSLAPIPLGDSDALKVGQFVVAIGNPFGLQQTVTFGVISSLGRIIESPEDGRFIGEAIQTDAAINPGNSGGPLLDLEGRVIGVNAQIISNSQDNAGIGFAIPVNTVRRVVPDLITSGSYAHPWLGVEIFDLGRWSEILQEAGEDVPDEGVLILSIVRSSPADQAGLRGGSRNIVVGNSRFPAGGDVITALNGEPIPSWQDLNIYLELKTRVGETVQVTVLRDGKEIVVPVVLAERP